MPEALQKGNLIVQELTHIAAKTRQTLKFD